MKWGMWVMKLKTSFFNNGIIFHALRRFSWIGIIYTLLIFFAVPMNLIMYHGKDEIYPENIKILFYFRENDIQSYFILMVPVLLGVLIFKYLQSKNSSDMLHCLPIRRNVVFRSYIFTGLIILTFPVMINAVISWCLKHYLNMGMYFETRDIIKWIAVTLAMNFTIFIVCVFSGMVSGMSIVQGILTYILLLLPYGFIIILLDNMTKIVYGFTYIEWNIEKLSPIVRLLKGFYEDASRHGDNYVYPMHTRELILYIIACISIYFVSKLLYSKRRLEAVSQAIVFKSLQYIFKYGVVFCSMMLAGIYFDRTQDKIYLGYFIGSIIGYLAAEMIIKKSFWVFKNIRGYVFYLVIVILFLEGIKVDITGYQKKLPALDNIKTVYFSEKGTNNNIDKNSYVERENIENIYRIHELLIKEKGNDKKEKDNTKRFTIMYKLDNGNILARAYNVNVNQYDKYFKTIYESSEYKKINYDIMTIDNSDVEKLDIYPRYGVQKNHVSIVDPKEIKEAIEVLKQDAANESYEQMNDGREAWANMNLMIADDKVNKYDKLKEYGDDRNKRFYIQWEKSYTLFEQWLNKKGYLEDARVMPKDIDYILVEEIESKKEWQARNRNGLYINMNSPKLMKITDKNEIEECLRNSGERWSEREGKYIMGLYWKDGSEAVSISEKNLPEFIKNYFK